ncbi:MAG TPA: 2OG-Fe(II) oxygenase family protein [Candidatus Nanoarchaeia archaeon]|nr:2OG-Fe(II) oxygenase family protein [Candidatus Nanoarchaeia archaeon]
MKWLQDNLSKDAAQQYKVAKPFPHIVVKDFFLPERAINVRDALMRDSFTRKDTDLFSFAQSRDIDGTTNKVLQTFYDFFSSTEMLRLVESITSVKPLKSSDMSGFLYEQGDYLLCHDDQLEGRKVAYIYNLSDNFVGTDGGALRLFSLQQGHPMKVVKSVLPSFNTLTLFTVRPDSFHDVQEVLSKKQRWSLTGWFYG